MRALLDTHVWLWMLTAPERLQGRALELIDDSRNELALSAASSWEIAIKSQLGKLQLPEAPDTFVPDRMRRTGVRGLAISHAHALRTSGLPALHRDPFDRLLIAQAQVESLPIVTSDPIFTRYDVTIIDAG